MVFRLEGTRTGPPRQEGGGVTAPEEPRCARFVNAVGTPVREGSDTWVIVGRGFYTFEVGDIAFREPREAFFENEIVFEVPPRRTEGT